MVFTDNKTVREWTEFWDCSVVIAMKVDGGESGDNDFFEAVAIWLRIRPRGVRRRGAN